MGEKEAAATGSRKKSKLGPRPDADLSAFGPEVMKWLQKRNLCPRKMIEQGMADPATGQNVIHLCMTDSKREPMLKLLRALVECRVNPSVWTWRSTLKPKYSQPIHILCQNKSSHDMSQHQSECLLDILLEHNADIEAQGPLCVDNMCVRRQASECIGRHAIDCIREEYRAF